MQSAYTKKSRALGPKQTDEGPGTTHQTLGCLRQFPCVHFFKCLFRGGIRGKAKLDFQIIGQQVFGSFKLRNCAEQYQRGGVRFANLPKPVYSQTGILRVTLQLQLYGLSHWRHVLFIPISSLVAPCETRVGEHLVARVHRQLERFRLSSIETRRHRSDRH